MITFSETEIREMQKNPDVLRALANYHDCQATSAEAVEPGLGTGNDKRRDELLKAADAIEESY